MDFVVVGLGLGTLAILSGLSLLTWVAGRWDRSAVRAESPDTAAYDAAIAASRRGAGQAVIGAGVAVIIATIAALAGSLDDQTGAFFVATAATVAALGLLFWAYLHRTRNPLPSRRRPRSEPAATHEPVTNGTGDTLPELRLTEVRLPVFQPVSDPEPAVAPPHAAGEPVLPDEVPTEEALVEPADRSLADEAPRDHPETESNSGAVPDLVPDAEPAVPTQQRPTAVIIEFPGQDRSRSEPSRNGAGRDPQALDETERIPERDRNR